jgi:hypothetical protein
MGYVKSNPGDSSRGNLQVFKLFSKNTVLFTKEYILDLICFYRGIIENWSRKCGWLILNQGGGERYGSFFEAGRQGQ